MGVLDLKKCVVTREEIRVARLSVQGDFFHVYWERDEAIAKAQIAKLLLGPDGIMAWIRQEAQRCWNSSDIDGSDALMGIAEDMSIIAGDLEWPMKETL